MWRSLILAAITFAGLPATAAEGAPPEGDDLGHYALDDVSREVAVKGAVRCPAVDLVTYKGDVIRYHKPVKVFAGFKARLQAFEAVVRDVAIEVYGRAPTRIRHLGTYNCRRIGGYPNLISEHGLGNGIDIAGFTFGRLARGEAAPDDLPRALRRGFSVDMLKHWGKDKGTAAVHARFLRRLADVLTARRDIFRVLLGPAYPGHKNHFHFDCAPYRLVVI